MAKINQRLAQYQDKYKNYYSLSADDEKSIRNQLPHPKYLEFIYNRHDYMPSTNNFFIDSYNAIKDETWPECTSINDLKKLPRHIIDECRDVHDFDFFIFEKEHITHEQWKNYKGGGEYPVTELIKFKNTVLDLSEYIYDKNIVDFACHAGLTSLVCLHNGARSVVATNVREEFVNLANECMSLSEFKNQFIAITADIHDYKINTKLSANCDTVLLYGIMYHVHDHVEIIESIVKSTPRYIIFDTDLDHSTKDDPRPLISWKTENSSFALAGYYNNYKTVPIGAPNESWFDLIMTSFQYKLVRNQRYDCAATGKFDITLSRSVMVYEFNPTTISGTDIHGN